MSILTISDTHFNSDSIIRYCDRPFKNAAEANAEMIRRWQSVVKENDTVYHLGDFIMGPHETVPRILRELPGHIHLVRGNHDTRRKLAIYEQYPEKVTIHDIAYLSYNGLSFVFCHFPITDESFLGMVVKDNSEVVIVHGHTHDKDPFFNAANHVFNVSADVTGFTPVYLDDMYSCVKNHFLATGVWRKPTEMREGDTSC